jgi:nucleotide-binding universal stress UspA family protein
VLCAEGKAFVEIIAAAERLDANVILLAARRAATPDPFTLGVTTEKVMRKSAKPVLAVPPDRPLRFKRIVCAVDFSDASARGLANAIRLSRAFSGELRIMTVTAQPEAYARFGPHSSISATTPEEAQAADPTQEFTHFLQQFDLRDIDWEQRVEHGEPAVEIIRSAREWDANLIVIGSTGRTGLARILMGSTALKVARQLPCALLTVKREAVLIAELEQNIADIQSAYAEGRELLRQDFCEQAIERFQQCLRLNAYFPPALDASAEAHDRLKHADQAEQCRRQAALIREQLWIRDSV